MFALNNLRVIRYVRPKLRQSTGTVFLSTNAKVHSFSPVIEHREYQLICGGAIQYMKSTTAHSELRKKLLPLRLFCFPDTGGLLNIVSHFYFYENGIEQRDHTRNLSGKHIEWQEYVKTSRLNVLQQKSTLYVEAPFIYSHGLCGMKKEILPIHETDEVLSDGQTAIYEIRKYKLRLGYDIIPKFLELYSFGLTSKLSAVGTDSTTQLCTVMYTEVGELNNVIEIWRHGGGAPAMTASRNAARNAKEWRQAVNEIAALAVDFTTSIHKPLNFSNWR